ncbi:phosphatase PAP2 family protein [Thermococcus peptonophilus]|uniref:Phosphatidic acid phosphatase n=1 Tax=Thermococcus peptonophilus TaxID=53952 RepID=A0A142CT39_9EURY|nr:phosphatase PAP2 family protein [Thermococcus peptonophilus]AMQ17941.1 phosphatidic acid phosphatase [Thermococcus peptonophilus]
MNRKPAVLGALTGFLLLILALQVMGLMDGVNTYVDAHLPASSSPGVRILTDTAEMVFFALIAIFFIILDIRERRHLSYTTLKFILSAVLVLMTVALLKALLQTPRPGEEELSLPLLLALKNVDYFAFPSGHTARASVLASYLQERFPRYAPLWWAYAVGIALTRLILRVHWFGDVLFSLLLGPWAYLLLDVTAPRWLLIYRKVVKSLRLEVFDVEQSP